MLPDGYQKQSFRRFDIGADIDRLNAEFSDIPQNYWANSYWGSIHCSVGMLLLRGGTSGTQSDFYSSEVADHEVLEQAPYIRSLIDKDGPFGFAKYAFLFRMRPNGITKLHKDTMDRWTDMYRIHVPIITNPDAHLIADGRSIHFAAGHAWSFDNQSEHGVVNGDQERVHLIFDVDLNDRLKDQIDACQLLKGERVAEHLERIKDDSMEKPSYFGDDVVRQGIGQLRNRGMNNAQIASFMNNKKVPLKDYYGDRWTSDMIERLSSSSG